MNLSENQLVVAFQRDWDDFSEADLVFPVLGRIASVSGVQCAVSLSEDPASPLVRDFDRDGIMTLQEYASWMKSLVEQHVKKAPWEDWMLEAFSFSEDAVMGWKQDRQNASYWRPCILLDSERCAVQRDRQVPTADSGVALGRRNNLVNGIFDFHSEADLVSASDIGFQL